MNNIESLSQLWGADKAKIEGAFTALGFSGDITAEQAAKVHQQINSGITTKTPKKTPAKQLESGDTTSAITSGATTTLTAPEAQDVSNAKPVAIPALTALEYQLNEQDATLNANAKALIHTKMEEMKGNLHNTVIDTMAGYAEMPDFFEMGLLFEPILVLASTDNPTIEVHSEPS